eukprot:TRINITY_DN804_c0_g1_i12.p1 TRINITY_DN804_c0_g1~~TRINITY_DN804_c0_g1_i12.p1  ORF type:complete len:212 (+),score=37.72 TRINITY_DN804_c0_g1_i12:969-1604(+)
MQLAYVFSTFGYQVAYSYVRSGEKESDDPFIDSQEKLAIGMAGFAIAKAIFTIAFTKTYEIMGGKVGLFILWGTCFVSLLVHAIVSLKYTDRFSFWWAVDGFFWGLQSSALADKEDTEYLNVVTEISDSNVDFSVILKTLAAMLIFILGAFLRNSMSIWLMLPLMAVYILNFVLTLLSMLKGKQGDSDVDYFMEKRNNISNQADAGSLSET